MRSHNTLDARRLLLAGAFALTVGIPTLACTGGSSDGAADDEVEEVEEVEDDGALNPEKAILGTWAVKPEESQLREMKIVNAAINNKGGIPNLNKKLDPDLSEAEKKTFNDLRAADPSSPEVEFAKMFIQMMRDARLEVDESKWTLTMAGETDSWSYTVESSSGDTLVVKLDSGETNELTFVDEKNIKVKIKEGGETMDVQFARR